MPESTLAVDFAEIKAQVTYLAHGTRDTSSLTSEEQANIDSIIRNGLRKFYYPQIVNAQYNHDWSFLKPVFTLVTVSGKSDYTQEGDFGGLAGDLQFSPDDNQGGPILKVPENTILEMRSWSTDTSGAPSHYAERPVRSGGLESQRWQIMLWPEPDGEYELKGRFRVSPNALTATQKYPYGGVEHAQTILEACLAEAEIQIDRQPGPHSTAFLTALAASIAYDQRGHSPDYLGYNGNRRRNNNPFPFRVFDANATATIES